MKNYNGSDILLNWRKTFCCLARKGKRWKAHPTVVIIATIFNSCSTVYDKGKRVATHKLNVNGLPVEISIANVTGRHSFTAWYLREKNETILMYSFHHTSFFWNLVYHCKSNRDKYKCRNNRFL